MTPRFTTRPEITGNFGVVAATHWLAAQAGMRMLEIGGNAFDAATATALTLQVVMPHLNGPAGDAPIMFARMGEPVQVLCGQGPASADASIERFAALGLDMVPGTGPLAAVIPGAFGAWLMLARDHGSLDIAEIMAPAIHYARTGWPLHADTTLMIAAVAELLRGEWSDAGKLWLRDGEVPAAGTLWTNTDLADTFERLLAGASGSREQRIEAVTAGFYRGPVAEAIDDYCRTRRILDTSGRHNGGLLTGDDLAGWAPSYEAPLTYDYQGVTVAKPGPWTQGPTQLQILALLKGYDLDDLDPNGAEFIHLWTEAAKLAFADRDAYYGDPNFVGVPMNQLLSDRYNDTRRELIGETASLEMRPGSVPGYVIGSARAERSRIAAAGAGEPGAMANAARPGDTCHIDVIDQWGNIVSATPSGGWLQSSPTIPGLGFPLNTRAQMFWLEPGLPGSLAPGKRPRTTLSPSMVMRDGTATMAYGTPGGDKQDQWSSLFLLRHLHHGMNLQEAIDAPQFDTDHFRNSFWPRDFLAGRISLEKRIGEATAADLRRRGHDVAMVDDWTLGWVSAAARRADRLVAGASPRGMQVYAVGR